MSKLIEIKNYEEFVKWFESVYKGNPIDIELRNKDGSYRCNIVFFKNKGLVDQYFKKKIKSLTFN